ncbi:MAG: hypothetical protein WAQ98_16255 [Blastocatellia bacterium]
MLKDILQNHYPPNTISEKIQYWGELWEDLVENFEKGFFGLKLNSPHLLILDIIEEFSYQGTINKDNKNLLQCEVDRLIKVDPVIQNEFKADFQLIRKYMGSGEHFLLVHCCKDILKNFTSGMYFKALFGYLRELLKIDTISPDEEESLKLINQHMIVDFMIKGFHLNTIKDIPSKLFDKYRIIGAYVSTSYPHNTDANNFVDGDVFDRSAYNTAVRDLIDNLTVSERIEQLLVIYLKPISQATFIFHLANPDIKSNEDFRVGEVDIYSPIRKQFLTPEVINNVGEQPLDPSEEFFGISRDRGILNIAVSIPYVDVLAGKEVALELMEKALNFFHFKFSSYAIPVINKQRFIMVDYTQPYVHTSYSSSINYNPINIDSRLLNTIISESSRNKADSLIRNHNSLSVTQQKIMNALRWFNKAEKANNYEDKLLNYWIVIESLIPTSLECILPNDARKSDINLIKEILPSHHIFHLINKLGWFVHDVIRQKRWNNKLDISDSVAEQIINEVCHVSYELYEVMSIKPFIQRINEFENAINDRLVKSKIAFVKEIYQNPNPKAWLKTINKINTEIKNEITLIYRLRNKIVHDAHYHSDIIPSYALIAKKHATNLLSAIFQEYDPKDATKSLEDIIMASYIKSKRIIERVERNLPVDLLNLDFL